jgi:hypothetical protein
MPHLALTCSCLVSLLASAAPAAQPAVTATKSSDLQFGTFSTGPIGGLVVLDPLGARHCTGELQPTAAASRPATFQLTGPPGARFTWSVGPDPARMGALTAAAFQLADPAGSLAFDSRGQAQVQIGATLAVPALCPAGSYRRDQVVLAVSCPGSPTCQATFSILAGMLASLAIVEACPLDFGTISAQDKAFTVTLSPAGQRSLAGGGACSPGAFQINGYPGALVSLSLPTSGIQLKGSGTSLALRNLTADKPCTFFLGTSGQATFHVGGSLTVNAHQAKGRYTGTYPVTVNYLF